MHNLQGYCTGWFIYYEILVATFLLTIQKTWLFDRTYPSDQINSRQQDIETLSQSRLSMRYTVLYSIYR
jgi:hypothetical protein